MSFDPREEETIAVTVFRIANDPPSAVSSPAEELMRTCPNCGRPLAERKCKLFCEDPRCGFFLSCADFY